ncbi:endonuclease V [Kineosporia sp. R_H_3]|uniref:endonuclease V n=1 Tax=Kineosporia sp. R_H_3 TaxID=1961848 RepID=UPI000B4AE6FF|nr:endonuclease V [Kineosporia sp. R_H_3]
MARYGAVDVHYPARGGAVAALVVADDPAFGHVVEERTAVLADVEPYCPGALYLRELPAVLAVLATTAPVDLLVVDGYVTLDPDGTPGLGARAHARLGIPVVGVAKTAYRSATHAVPVLRGAASRPLLVTAAGTTAAAAADLVRAMAGPYRLPTALQRVDRLCREGHLPVRSR